MRPAYPAMRDRPGGGGQMISLVRVTIGPSGLGGAAESRSRRGGKSGGRRCAALQSFAVARLQPAWTRFSAGVGLTVGVRGPV